MKRFFKILRNIAFIFLGLLIVLAVLLNTTPFQNFLTQRAASLLSDKLQTKVTVRNFRFHLFNSADLEGLFIADQTNDTLLYAGDAQIHLTDWVFGGKNKIIHYIGLKDTKIFLHRYKNKNQWNYSFLEKLFDNSESASNKKGNISIQFDLKKLALKNIRFIWKDEWVGTDYEAAIGSMILKPETFNFKSKKIVLASLNGNRLLFGITQYTGGRPPHPYRPYVYPMDSTPFNPAGWHVSLKHLKITDSRFYLDWPEEKTPVGFFDADHLDITGINTDIKNIKIVNDTVFGHVNDLSAKERCGLAIKTMQADVRVSPILSECSRLFLQTNNSTLRGYYAMHYDRFPDFIDYINKVKMTGRLRNSNVGIRDIVYFAPELERFKDLSVQVSGNGEGTVAHLSGNHIHLYDGHSTLNCNMVMNGLPDIYQTFIDLRNIQLHSTGAAALFYAPELTQQTAVHLKALTTIDFSGNYTGFIRDFVAKGKINTNLGNLKADLNMKLPVGERAVYSGNLTASDFETGKLLNQNTIGKTSFNLNINAKGLNPKTLDGKVSGNIGQLEFNHYLYQNIKIDGAFTQQIFNGLLMLRDTNANLDFNGKIDFSKAVPACHFDALIHQLNFQPLHFTKKDIRLAANLQMNMQGNDLDHISGSAHFSNVSLFQNGKRLTVDSLGLMAQLQGNNFHNINLYTNNASLQVYGQFSPSDLLNSLKMYFSYYLPEYMLLPEDVGNSRSIHFKLKAGDISSLLSLLNPNVKLKGMADISGSIDLTTQKMSLNGIIKHLGLGKINTQTAYITGLSDFSGLHLNLDAADIRADTNQILSDLKLETHISRDTARFQLETTSPTTIEKASLNGLAYAYQDSLFMSLTSSQFNFNDEVWKIPSGNRITLAKNFIAIQHLTLNSGDQQIAVNPKGAELKGNNALVKLSNIKLNPINSFINLYGNKLDGLLNGEIKALSLLDSSQYQFSLKGKNVTLQNDTLGTVFLNGVYHTAQKKISFSENSGIHNNSADLGLLGTIDFSKPDKVALNGEALLNSAKLSWIAPFLEGYVHHISGTANGVIHFSGDAANLLSNGTVWLSQAAFSPDLTGVDYHIPKGKITVTNTQFIADSVLVYDASGQKGLLTGAVRHNGLSDFQFNLKMNSNQIKVIDRDKFENGYFYGDVNAKVNLTISGPWEDLTMHVIATPLPESQLFLTVDNSSDISNYTYISFLKKGSAIPVIKQNFGNKFNFILDAVVNPNLETTLILDPKTGDKIWAKGNGNLILNIPSEGDMKMTGNYVISEGTYNFSFQQLQVLNYKRAFTINSGSSIKWNGGLTDADLDVTAHTAVKARLYDLISDEVNRLNLSNSEIYDAQVKQNIDVLMNMKGSLEKPDLSFKMQLAESRSIGTYAYQKLQRINTDEKQTLIQVSSLLLLGQFVPPEGINSSAISSGTINNMSELFSSVASSQITNFANKLLGMQDLTVGVQYKNYSMSEASPLSQVSYFNRNEAQVNLRKNFLNNRLIVEVGGAYDWGQAGTGGNYTANLAGDFRIQYLLSPDGRVRFSIFRTSDYDPLYSLKTIGRQGVNLSYRKSFNNLKDFFSKNNWQTPRLRLQTNKSHSDSAPEPVNLIRQKLNNAGFKKTDSLNDNPKQAK